MPNTKQTEYQPVTFDAIRIRLASPDKIRGDAREGKGWSYGEVTKPETINYRSLKPEDDGLFCQKIFGPTKDWECKCGKYKKIRYKGITCDRCHVEITKSSVRRERMGHIDLAAPVSHIWYFKGIPSRMGGLLEMSPKDLDKVLYFASYVVLDTGESQNESAEFEYEEEALNKEGRPERKTRVDKLNYKDVLSETQYQEARRKFGNKFRVGMGAEAIKELLMAVDLDKEYKRLTEEMESPNCHGQRRTKVIKTLEIVEAFKESGNDPSWMILDAIPVIPPDLRPMVQLDGGRFATSDLNDLYRRIINRNNRLKRLLQLGAPDIIVRNEKRMLQEAVDALIDNGRRGRPVTGPGNRALKSLSDMLKGKSGRFRQNLLGKRVDYSGRSVIVVGPEMKIYQCGVPKEMALELFKPFVMKELEQRKISQNIKNAKKLVEHVDDQVWDILEEVIKEHPVMLNRAPTLHRLGIQAFEPILVEGKAIKLHPLACTAFNADFDGDQMAIHLPLSVEAQAECRFLLLSPNNLLKPSDGGPVAVPSQDMVLGCYYITQARDGEPGENMNFSSMNEAWLAYENKVITLHTWINVRLSKTRADGTVATGMVRTTLGRLIFNEKIPQDLGFVDRSKEENFLLPEINNIVKKTDLKRILQAVIDKHGTFRCAEVDDDIKALGYKWSTIAALTVSIADITVPAQKAELIEQGQKTVAEIQKKYRRGLLTESERYEAVVRSWTAIDKELTQILIHSLQKCNNIFMMADSGARGSNQQIKQLAGMRGLMADTSGRTIELPIKSNFREGLDVLEYFMSAHGSRKGMSDTALRTADSGYLTRRMVDVSQELIIREIDCAEGKDVIPGMPVAAFKDGKPGKEDLIEELKDRIQGRVACEDIKDVDGNVIVKKNHMITPSRAKAIVSRGVNRKGEPIDPNKDSIKIRTILTCRSHAGICAKCYGANMATGEMVQVGEAVGIIAAQSIGEPGTQLTMRTFHTGGVAGGDITQGLPRVEELFEARKPKGLAIISDIAGVCQIKDSKNSRSVLVVNNEGGEDNTREYPIPYGARFKVVDGQTIEAGDELTEGSVNPHDLLKIKGTRAVQDYLLREVQRVYRLQGVEICDKHIEVIVRQMLKKKRIEESGDSRFLPGSLVDVLDFEDENERIIDKGGTPATGTPIILGITKSALATDSFMSAASFQETTKVLTDAAIRGRIDPLIGLKENVIIGKLIPAGTGMKRYTNTKLSTDERVAAALEAAKLAESGRGGLDEDGNPTTTGEPAGDGALNQMLGEDPDAVGTPAESESNAEDAPVTV